jgi:hypothetical protein
MLAITRLRVRLTSLGEGTMGIAGRTGRKIGSWRMSRVRGTGIGRPGIMRLTHIGVLELPVSRVVPPGLLAMPSEGMPPRLVPLGPLTMPPVGMPPRLLEIRLIPPGLGA